MHNSVPVYFQKILSYQAKIHEDFDWFKLRRKVSVLSFFEGSDKNTLDEILKKYGKNHIQAPGTLTLCQGDNATNKFIKVWHKKSIYKNKVNTDFSFKEIMKMKVSEFMFFIEDSKNYIPKVDK